MTSTRRWVQVLTVTREAVGVEVKAWLAGALDTAVARNVGAQLSARVPRAARTYE